MIAGLFRCIQINHIMKTDIKTRNLDVRPDYAAPQCRVIPVKVKKVMCTSPIEPVDEVDGEW